MPCSRWANTRIQSSTPFGTATLYNTAKLTQVNVSFNTYSYIKSRGKVDETIRTKSAPMVILCQIIHPIYLRVSRLRSCVQPNLIDKRNNVLERNLYCVSQLPFNRSHSSEIKVASVSGELPISRWKG